jgi:hypothetical protein
MLKLEVRWWTDFMWGAALYYYKLFLWEGSLYNLAPLFFLAFTGSPPSLLPPLPRLYPVLWFGQVHQLLDREDFLFGYGKVRVAHMVRTILAIAGILICHFGLASGGSG